MPGDPAGLMFDPGSLLAQAFLGSDLGRLLWTSAAGSLLVSSKVRAWQVAVLVFLLDRALPFWDMASEYETDVVMAAIFGMLAELPADLPALALRFLGVYGIVALLWRARLAIHGRRPVTKAEPGTA